MQFVVSTERFNAKNEEIFYVDVSTDEFKILKIKEMSDVWITFPPESGIALQGSQ